MKISLFLLRSISTFRIQKVSGSKWSDNSAISDSAPGEYYSQYAQRCSAEILRSMHYWHALPDGWECMEFETFLQARRKAIARVIRDGFFRLKDEMQ